SINNYADYAATNLQYYGLVPDSAEYDGEGTVWTHQAVSTYLGGTNHTDPHGYLASFGYSYDELYDLMYEKYLNKEREVAAWGEASSGSTSGSEETSDNDSTENNDTVNNNQLTVSELTNKQGTVSESNHGV